MYTSETIFSYFGLWQTRVTCLPALQNLQKTDKHVVILDVCAVCCKIQGKVQLEMESKGESKCQLFNFNLRIASSTVLFHSSRSLEKQGFLQILESTDHFPIVSCSDSACSSLLYPCKASQSLTLPVSFLCLTLSRLTLITLMIII